MQMVRSFIRGLSNKNYVLIASVHNNPNPTVIDVQFGARDIPDSVRMVEKMVNEYAAEKAEEVKTATAEIYAQIMDLAKALTRTEVVDEKGVRTLYTLVENYIKTVKSVLGVY